MDLTTENQAYYNNQETVIIPKTTSTIPAGYFRNSNVKKVYIPRNIKKIESGAFSDCACLETLSFPEESELEYIGSYCFSNCKNLKSINVPKNAFLDYCAFFNCPSLMDKNGYVVINNILFGYFNNETIVSCPHGIEYVSGLSFGVPSYLEQVYDNSNIREIHFPSTLKEIYGWAIPNSVIKVVVPNSSILTDGSIIEANADKIPIPYRYRLAGSKKQLRKSEYDKQYVLKHDHLDRISASAASIVLESSIYLEMIIIDKSINCIPSLFEGKKYKEVLIEEGPQRVGEDAFLETNIKTLKLPNSIRIIEEGAFALCTELENIHLGNVEEIYDYAFEGCESLKELYLPKSIKMIGKDVFVGCQSLKKIYIPACFQFDTALLPSNDCKIIEYSENQEDFACDNNAFNELNALIGLKTVKNEINELIALVKFQQKRKNMGKRINAQSYHLVFTGNPGTGKTTVARIVANIYKELGLLSSGHLIETDRSGLVAGYVGQTALKTQEVIEKALGGVLFIDEAYSLQSNSNEDYGHEAITTLLKAMEDNRDDLVVIVAGYEDKMESFIHSNPGLESRFSTYIHFEDYSSNEMVEIFKLMAKQEEMILAEGVEEELNIMFDNVIKSKDWNFANGRTVRNYYEQVIRNVAKRVDSRENLGEEEFDTITINDL